jgi:hypothetical protein
MFRKFECGKGSNTNMLESLVIGKEIPSAASITAGCQQGQRIYCPIFILKHQKLGILLRSVEFISAMPIPPWAVNYATALI